MMLNNFLGKPAVVKILIDNPKTRVLFSEKTQALAKVLAPIAFSLFGFPLSITARMRAVDVFKLLSKITSSQQGPLSLVDIGCSYGGAHTFELVKRLRSGKVLGIDIDPISIEVASNINQELGFKNLEFIQLDITDSTLQTEAFDIVFSTETLEHIQDDVFALKTFSNMLTDNGWLILSVPYHEDPREYEEKQESFDKMDLPGPDGELFPGGFHWRDGYNQANIQQRLESAGFVIHEIGYTNTLNFSSSYLLFPIIYPLSRLLSPFFGKPAKINVLAQKG